MDLTLGLGGGGGGGGGPWAAGAGAGGGGGGGGGNVGEGARLTNLGTDDLDQGCSLPFVQLKGGNLRLREHLSHGRGHLGAFTPIHRPLGVHATSGFWIIRNWPGHCPDQYFACTLAGGHDNISNLHPQDEIADFPESSLFDKGTACSRVLQP